MGEYTKVEKRCGAEAAAARLKTAQFAKNVVHLLPLVINGQMSFVFWGVLQKNK